MQKIFLYTLVFIALVLACEPYEEFYVDNEFTSVYFPIQQPVRQIVVGEGLYFNIGVALGGRRANYQDETVSFEIDESLMEGTPLKALPREYYSLSSDSEIVIPEGEFRGLIKVTIDSSLFVNDDSCFFQHYAIPLRILSTSVDTVLENKDYTIFAVRAYNPYHAVYYHTGKSISDTNGVVVDETIFTRSVSSNNAIWKVYSSSFYSVTTDGIDRYISNDEELYRMRLNLDDNDVTITNDTNSVVEVIDLGGSKYNPTERNFTLNYSFRDTLFMEADTNWHPSIPDSILGIAPANQFPVTKTVYDTLIFRNVPLFYEEWETPTEE